MASGEVVGAIATEPGTGSDLQNVTTRAVRDGDEYVVHGSKTFITNGGQADLIIVVAKTDTTTVANGISLVIVGADRPGFRRGRVLDKIGQNGQDTTELFFDDVRCQTPHQRHSPRPVQPTPPRSTRLKAKRRAPDSMRKTRAYPRFNEKKDLDT